MNTLSVRDLIKKHEGVRLAPYRDSLGILTIGVGFNMTRQDMRQRFASVGIPNLTPPIRLTMVQADALLDLDIADAALDLAGLIPSFHTLSENRQAALIDMRFNLGPSRIRAFKNTLAAIEAGDFSAAADGMLQSVWAHQVHGRANEDAELVRNG